MITITNKDIGREVRLRNGETGTIVGWSDDPISYPVYVRIGANVVWRHSSGRILHDCECSGDIVAFTDEKETKPMTTPKPLSMGSKEYLDQFLKDFNLVAIPEPEGGLKSCSKCALQGTQMCQEAPCGVHNVHFENAPQLTPDERKYLDAPTSEFAKNFSSTASNESDPTGRAPSTPGAKLDAGKAPVLRGVLQYFPRAILAVAEVSAHGASKYTWNGWETVPDGIPRYGDALVRHLIKEAIEGPADKDSHLTHMAHEAWNALARLELMLREKEVKGGSNGVS